jgi:four helix bundle protein
MPSLRPAARSFRDLLVWRKAHEFVLAVYAFTAGFPKQETYGLSLQMRRAAISIPANIAEGFRRRSKAEKARYMNIAEGSLEESRYYLILAQDLGYGDTDKLNSALEEVSRLLGAYAAAILTSSTSDFHIPKGYQGRSPWLVRALRTMPLETNCRAIDAGCCSSVATRRATQRYNPTSHISIRYSGKCRWNLVIALRRSDRVFSDWQKFHWARS